MSTTLSFSREKTCVCGGGGGGNPGPEKVALKAFVAEPMLFQPISHVIKYGTHTSQHVCKDRLKHLWTERWPSSVFIEAEQIHLWTQLRLPLKYPNMLQGAREATALSVFGPTGTTQAR